MRTTKTPKSRKTPRRFAPATGSEDRLAAWIQHELCRTYHVAVGADGAIRPAQDRWAKWERAAVHDDRKRAELIAYRHLAAMLTRMGFRLPNEKLSRPAAE